MFVQCRIYPIGNGLANAEATNKHINKSYSCENIILKIIKRRLMLSRVEIETHYYNIVV